MFIKLLDFTDTSLFGLAANCADCVALTSQDSFSSKTANIPALNVPAASYEKTFLSPLIIALQRDSPTVD